MGQQELPGCVECLFCGLWRDTPEMSLKELRAHLHSLGLQGKLNDAKDAIAAICPSCERSDCPECGHPIMEHQDEHGLVTNCDGTRR
jgi:hypothetical protein